MKLNTRLLPVNIFATFFFTFIYFTGSGDGNPKMWLPSVIFDLNFPALLLEFNTEYVVSVSDSSGEILPAREAITHYL